MKKTLTALALTAAVLLGLSACSGSTELTAPEVTTEAPAPEPEATTEVDAETLETCMDLAGPFSEASLAMAKITADGKVPPQEVVDMWTALVDALGSVASSTSNAEVKAAASAAHEDFAALRDAMQKVYVEGEMSAMADYVAATAAIEPSYRALLELCTPESA